MPPNQAFTVSFDGVPNAPVPSDDDSKIRVAVLGCGMMGQEHISYISGYPSLRIDYLCDPHEPSLDVSWKVMKEFYREAAVKPTLFTSEDDLLAQAHTIDLLVICSPNYLHTPALRRWGQHDITILCEKPVAVTQEQHEQLQELQEDPFFMARIWVAMEYRYIPAIAKLLDLLPTIGDLRMVTIRENRYPFLHKIGAWNRDIAKTGDSLVEKCCHFFDLFRLITGKEVKLQKIRALAQRGFNYQDEQDLYETPIMDSAYVTMPFESNSSLIGCLELCMFAEGSRHQEEIIVTGSKGRLEAYLPENKVYAFARPDHDKWIDRSIPPPRTEPTIYDCSSLKDVFGIDEVLPTHGGYHYSSTSVEWYHLIRAISSYQVGGIWNPQVSLVDGLRAVEIGLQATRKVVNEANNLDE